MTCSEFIEGFSDYVDGEGDPRTLDAARAHLGECERCRRYEDVYARGIALLRSFPSVSVSQEFEPALEVRLRRDTAAALQRLDHRPPTSGSAMAVVFGMAVILVGAAWAPFLFSRAPQVELAPIVASYPTRGLQARMPEIDLLPGGGPNRAAGLPASELWDEASALIRSRWA
jgi:anti-sigma factor RsiW